MVVLMKIFILISIIYLLTHAVIYGQQPPSEMDESLPIPATNTIEVRFAFGKKAIKCKYFNMSAKTIEKEFISGKFTSGFPIPSNVPNDPENNTFELEIKCDKYQWHFQEIGLRAFTQGYWWIGTDYPPFQERLEWIAANDDAWIQYFILRPTNYPGFIVYKRCPENLKDLKPGPCYED